MRTGTRERIGRIANAIHHRTVSAFGEEKGLKGRLVPLGEVGLAELLAGHFLV